MKLSALLQACGLRLPVVAPNSRLSSLAPEGNSAADTSVGDVALRSITADSRKAGPGALFVALRGSLHDGAAFIPLALSQGAVAIATTCAPGETEGIVFHYDSSYNTSHEGDHAPENGRYVPYLRLAEPARFLAQAAAILAGRQPRFITAITGTNGKSSTADFLRQLWTLRGKRAASIGTLGLVTDAELPPLPPLTTPDPVSLADALAALAREGVEHVALEASSHGLAQNRLDGVALTAGGFSNLTRDHLDYHGTLDAYRTAKLRLFADLLRPGSVAALNVDMDAETLDVLRNLARKRGLVLREIGENGTTLKLLERSPEAGGQTVRVALNGIEQPSFFLPLTGAFQVDNALLAAVLCWETETDAPDILALLPHLKGVPGRCERVAVLSNGAAAYVDYAHTPDALERVLMSLRPHAQGKLVVVFGAGGNRDRGKRPLMGQIAAHLADSVIVTDDNPRNETAAAIRADILAACPGAREIGDRKTAIETALAELGPGDVLLVAGKGHEKGQIVGETVLPFDDRALVAELAKKRSHEAANAPDNGASDRGAPRS